MCRRVKHLQQLLYAYSQNTLNDHTYKKGGRNVPEMPHLDPPIMMVLQQIYNFLHKTAKIATRFEHK